MLKREKKLSGRYMSKALLGLVRLASSRPGIHSRLLSVYKLSLRLEFF